MPKRTRSSKPLPDVEVLPSPVCTPSVSAAAPASSTPSQKIVKKNVATAVRVAAPPTPSQPSSLSTSRAQHAAPAPCEVEATRSRRVGDIQGEDPEDYSDHGELELRGKPLQSAEEKERRLLEDGMKLSGLALKDFLANRLLCFNEDVEEEDSGDEARSSDLC